MNNKKKIIIITVSFLVLIGVVLSVIFLIPKGNNEEIENQNKGQIIKVTGKLQNTLKFLNNNYTIKYSGDFLNEQNEVVNAIVEFTKFNNNFAIKSDKLGINYICENNYVKSISTRYKMIAVMPKSAISIVMYNPVEDFGQKYNKTYKEKINDKEYDVEEYLYKDIIVKYYFLNDDIKIIKYNDRLLKVIRIQNTVNKDLFNVPTGYKTIG